MGTARAEQLRKRLAQGLAARPILRGALRALGAGCFCFVLAGAGLLSEHVPLALAPVCVLPFGAAAVCAYLGAAAGYAMFWGLSSALEPVAAGASKCGRSSRRFLRGLHPGGGVPRGR